MTSRPEHAVVVGAGVAGLAAAWTFARAGVRVTVLERGRRIGGLVESEQPEPGVLVEHGADGILASKPGGLPVLRALGLEGGLVRGGRAPRRAFVWTGGDLVLMPPGLFAFERRALASMMRSPLLSRRAKARLLLEPFMPRGPVEQTVGDFFERRFGREVRDRLVAPMLRGLYGAPPDAIALRTVFPTLAAYEERFGSIGVALLVAKRTVTPGQGLVALQQGMAAVPQALADRLGDRVHLGVGVRRIARSGAGVRLALDDGATLDADALVVATPVQTAAALLADLVPALGAALGDVVATDADVVNLAFERRQVEHPLDGTGFVVGAAGHATLACTFASEKWHGRAPEGLVVLRSVLHGDLASDEDVLARALEELRPVIGLRGAPRWTRLRRRRAALPALAPGRAARIATALEQADGLGPIALAGNYLRGVGVPDAIATGIAAATRLLGLPAEPALDADDAAPSRLAV